MNVSFTPLKRGHAEEIVTWSYNPPYDVYNYGEEETEAAIEFLADRRNGFYGVMSDGKLIGFRSFGRDGRVPGGDYDESHLDTGGGLRPDLTGKGLGAEILQKGIEFGSREFGTECFRVTVAAFNQRAIKVCRRCGFEEVQRFYRPGDGREFVVLTLSPAEKKYTH